MAMARGIIKKLFGEKEDSIENPCEYFQKDLVIHGDGFVMTKPYDDSMDRKWNKDDRIANLKILGFIYEECCINPKKALAALRAERKQYKENLEKKLRILAQDDTPR